MSASKQILWPNFGWPVLLLVVIGVGLWAYTLCARPRHSDYVHAEYIGIEKAHAIFERVTRLRKVAYYFERLHRSYATDHR